jgi:hypothetical protein
MTSMARDLMTIRVEPRTRARLAVAARRSGRTPSAVARLALDAWLDGEGVARAAAPYDAMADLIGCIRGGDAKRSTRRARAIAEGLRARGASKARRR